MKGATFLCRICRRTTKRRHWKQATCDSPACKRENARRWHNRNDRRTNGRRGRQTRIERAADPVVVVVTEYRMGVTNGGGFAGPMNSDETVDAMEG